MSITIREVDNRNELKTFIYLPEKIHQGHKNWVHPLYTDEWAYFDRSKNKFFNSNDAILALAYREGRAVGRIMGIINPAYNATHHEKNARFCFLECYQDPDIARALLAAMEQWALSKGMTRLVGPLGFSDKDPQGMLIEGFDEEPLIATNFNFPWMNDFLVGMGYDKEVDLVCYKVDIPEEIPEFLQKVYQRAIQRDDLIMHEFTTRKALKPWIVPIFELINETYRHIYGFMPVTRDEMYEFADRYLPVLNPRFIKLITNRENQVLAFLISMPELSAGIRRARGRLFPIGWIPILIESRRTRLLTMLLGAIKPSHRGKGLDALMGIKLLESARKAGMKIMDSHLILEHNTRMRAEYERMKGVVHKRYRVYAKSLQ